jgi:hypothetical protein
LQYDLEAINRVVLELKKVHATVKKHEERLAHKDKDIGFLKGRITLGKRTCFSPYLCTSILRGMLVLHLRYKRASLLFCQIK